MDPASSTGACLSGRLPRLWLARLDAPLPPGARAWLDADERERLGRVSHPDAHHARAAAWALRRWALTGAVPEVAPAEWRFAQGPHGKPELHRDFAALGLHHSLSHGGAYAAVLVADAPCGVDVEALPDGLEAAAVAFGPRERGSIAAHTRPAERFLQHRTLKEAALKLLGTGFSSRAEQLELAVAPDGASAVPEDAGSAGSPLPASVMLRSWPLPDGHRLAAALSRPAVIEPCWADWCRS